MFGLNGRSFLSNIAGHWAVHYQGDVEKVWKRVDLKETLKTVKRSRADVIGICEVLEGEEKELKRGLKILGYNYIYFAKGHKTKFSNLGVKVCLASKIKCRHVHVENLPLSNKFGGGGGAINCYFPSKRMNVIFVHLACRPELRDKQIKKLEGHFEKASKIVFIGDFNTDYDNIYHHFLDFNLVTGRVKTCSMTPIVSWFLWKDLDHILEKGFKKKSVGSLEGRSDHKLLWVDLE